MQQCLAFSYLQGHFVCIRDSETEMSLGVYINQEKKRLRSLVNEKDTRVGNGLMNRKLMLNEFLDYGRVPGFDI
jgi:hypothetical protein